MSYNTKEIKIPWEFKEFDKEETTYCLFDPEVLIHMTK